MFNLSRTIKKSILAFGVAVSLFSIFKLSFAQKNGGEVVAPNTSSEPAVVNSDPRLKSLVAVSGFSHGVLAFGDYQRIALTGEIQWASFIEIRQIQGKSVVRSSIKVEYLLHAIEPQFSPNGKSLLYKVGASLERYGQYKIVLLNLADKKIKAGPQGISYLKISWSPDSKHLAYVKNGDAEGNELSPKRPLQLFVYDIESGKEKLIAQNSLVTQFCWTPSNSLLFCQQSGHEQAIKRGLRPSIYEARAEGGLPRLLVADAFDPQPSPDGQKIAFFGWSDKSALGLYVYSRGKKDRQLLYNNLSYIQSLGKQWSLDGQKLLFLQQITQSPNAKSRLSMVNLLNNKVSQVAIFKATDYGQFVRSRVQPQFELIGMSNNDNYAYVKTSEYVGEDDPYLINQISVTSVSIRTGETAIGAKVVTNAGVDWEDLSP